MCTELTYKDIRGCQLKLSREQTVSSAEKDIKLENKFDNTAMSNVATHCPGQKTKERAYREEPHL